jgi:N-acetylmuramoyl-L-alanine amidase
MYTYDWDEHDKGNPGVYRDIWGKVASIYDVIDYFKSQAASKGLIAIDPGHGDTNNKGVLDPGAKNGLVYEKDIALAIANAVNEYLQRNFFSTIMTRTGDVGQGEKFQWRIDAAEGSVIFVSIHVNDAKNNTTANGFEVYYQGNNIESQNLAQKISDAITLFSNRGIKDGSNLGVLKRYNGPAVLVETGFINNPEDFLILTTKAAQIGIEIATGIMNFLINQ